jgi:hypothetical protein
MQHPAQRHSINDAAVDAKTNDATRKLGPSQQEPNGFAELPIRIGINRSSTNCPLCDRET